MKLFGRNFPVTVILSKLTIFAVVAVRVTILFQNPVRLLHHYLRSWALPEKMVTLRNGHRIFLSSYPNDLVTIMVLFGKREYGDIPNDGIVVDIGANIGAFCVYAKLYGAKRVIAFEPNKESFEILQKNITENGFEDSVTALNIAVSSEDDQRVYIPIASDPNNITSRQVENEDSGFTEVKTIKLATILDRYRIEQLDLLKVDCEGAEYEIIDACDRDTFNRIKRLRFEYHRGHTDLSDILLKNNFRIVGYYPDNDPDDGWDKVGRIFYSRV